MGRIRVLITDGHSIFREELKMLLVQQQDIEIVGEAKNGIEVIRMAQDLHPDILLLDVTMPALDVFAALPQIRAKSPRTKVIILSEFLDAEFIVKAIQSGARGYLLKTSSHTELTKAIRVAHAGELWVERRVLTLVVEGLRQRLQGAKNNPNSEISEMRDVLTIREQEIVKWMMQGKTNKAIASELTISEKTVKTHVSNIFSKLHINRRLELLLKRVADRVGETP